MTVRNYQTRQAKIALKTPNAEEYLPRRHYEVLRLRAEGHTLGEIGTRLGHYEISKTRVGQIEREALRLLTKNATKNTPEGMYRDERFG